MPPPSTQRTPDRMPQRRPHAGTSQGRSTLEDARGPSPALATALALAFALAAAATPTGLLALRVLHRLVDGEDEACRLTRGTQGALLHDDGLPDVLLEGVCGRTVDAIHTKPAALCARLCMLLAERLQDFRAIPAAVLCESHWDDLQSSREIVDHKLLLAFDGASVLAQKSAKLHLDGAAAAYDLRVAHGAAYDHDGVVQRALGLVDELLRATSDEDGGGLGLGAAREKVDALGADLLLLELPAGAEHRGRDALHRRLHVPSHGPAGALQVRDLHSAGAENIAVGEVLCGEVADG
mmetsp:Transcript_46084/g.117009  ORF Transcript_46084/g.117009 Transcript_46084/m.117009 type:complete len:295 (-) Transcript_46084:932-1816(-)